MEDFTFPCVPLELEQQCNAKTLPFPHFASPWLVAGSVVDTAHEHRRSFSAVEPQPAVCIDHRSVSVSAVAEGGDDYHHHHHHGSARFAVEEDKMDMLWEDFNEELARAAAAPPCPLTTKGSPWTKESSSWLAGDGDDGEDIVHAESRRHAVVRRKRMGLLTMLRLLKKLFLARKSGAKAPPI